MPLQNRVDPFGAIHAVARRGLFTGNRGVIHDPSTRTLLSRRWSTKAWIICDCGYQGLKRDVMGRNAPSGGAGWTNLFFLDEVTALAAGHRPCFLCRREKAREFADCFGKAFNVARPKAPAIDARLHRERMASAGVAAAIDPEMITSLPDGAMIGSGGVAFAIRGGVSLRWSFAGYGHSAASPGTDTGLSRLITAATTVAVLRAGYTVTWHRSATP